MAHLVNFVFFAFVLVYFATAHQKPHDDQLNGFTWGILVATLAHGVASYFS